MIKNIKYFRLFLVLTTLIWVLLLTSCNKDTDYFYANFEAGDITSADDIISSYSMQHTGAKFSLRINEKDNTIVKSQTVYIYQESTALQLRTYILGIKDDLENNSIYKNANKFRCEYNTKNNTTQFYADSKLVKSYNINLSSYILGLIFPNRFQSNPQSFISQLSTIAVALEKGQTVIETYCNSKVNYKVDSLEKDVLYRLSYINVFPKILKDIEFEEGYLQIDKTYRFYDTLSTYDYRWYLLVAPISGSYIFVTTDSPYLYIELFNIDEPFGGASKNGMVDYFYTSSDNNATSKQFFLEEGERIFIRTRTENPNINQTSQYFVHILFRSI